MTENLNRETITSGSSIPIAEQAAFLESVFLHFCIIIYDRSIKGTVWKRGVALNDKKIIEGIIRKDEQLFAIVIRKYSGLLWKIAASVLINAGSAQDVEEFSKKLLNYTGYRRAIALKLAGVNHTLNIFWTIKIKNDE